ncbi:UDP-glucose dehydrogenase family protein [Aquifex aeolicus]|uniref:UDP-glucose 6-dehydrogenase n=1 Tax=Aquifex aeolicus (strain VF5) TaxID=224324 RepID=O66443_AQUAE|nr:UDP-glucose/GDP-mannose dehydrogenase family protein [Aquifex aeolicus]AAC06391.1 nucleotide sugar dehydrogenase [Aquifex aeolicus VF5]
MKLSVIGGGYVGLVTAACFSHLGHEVLVVEKIPEKVELLRRGKSPIYEPGLEELLREGINEGRLSFTTDIKEGIEFSEVIFICVGTPSNPDGSADLSQVEEVARFTAKYMDSYKLLVNKSTVPVGTQRKVKRTVRLYLKNKELEFDVASNPEFLREGHAVKDFLEPDRIVVGVESERAKEVLLEIYKPITDKGFPILITNPPTAEIIKYASNTFLATKISFINMISDLCEKVGANVEEVAQGMGYDKRIGKEFLRAGLGWGGSCLPKDTKAFIRILEELGVDATILKGALGINESRVDRLLQKLKDALWILKGKTIAIWGLSFKPNTDDIREAPSLKVVERLLREGAKIRAYDPKATENFKRVFIEGEDLRYFDDKYKAVEGAEALLILTEWDEFKRANLERVKRLMELPIIIDGRNIYDPQEVRNLGFEYYSMGRP